MDKTTIQSDIQRLRIINNCLREQIRLNDKEIAKLEKEIQENGMERNKGE